MKMAAGVLQLANEDLQKDDSEMHNSELKMVNLICF